MRNGLDPDLAQQYAADAIATARKGIIGKVAAKIASRRAGKKPGGAGTR